MANSHELVIVGSSPINLMEAVHQARSGASVLVVEERPFLGGAWYTSSHWGLDNLEVGCHKIECSKAAYDLIDSMGARMWSMSPQPQLIIKGTPPAASLRRRMFYGVLKAANRVMGRGAVIPYPLHDRLEQALRLRWGRALRGFEYKYFRKGCAVMVQALEEQALGAGVAFRRGFRVETVHVREEGVQVEGADGERIACDHCLITKNVRLRILVKGEEQRLRRHEFEGRHFLLKIDGSKLVDFLHVDLFNTTLIRQLTDVGYYSEAAGLVLCANVLKRTDAVQNAIPIASEPISGQERDALIQEIFAALKEEGFISADSRLLDSFMEAYPICSNNDDDLTAIVGRSFGRLRVLWTLDLALGIERRLSAWSRTRARMADHEARSI